MHGEQKTDCLWLIFYKHCTTFLVSKKICRSLLTLAEVQSLPLTDYVNSFSWCQLKEFCLLQFFSKRYDVKKFSQQLFYPSPLICAITLTTTDSLAVHHQVVPFLGHLSTD